MVEKKPQTMRFSDRELKLIKNTFKDNEEALIAIRKSLWQKELTEREDVMIKTLSPEVLKVIRKYLVPELEGGLPFGQELDLWSDFPADQISVKEITPHIEARKRMILYLKQEMNILEGAKVERKVNIIIDGDNIDQATIIARNNVINHIEKYLNVINIMAKTNEDTMEELVKKQIKNSSK